MIHKSTSIFTYPFFRFLLCIRESLAGRLQNWRAHRTVEKQQLTVIEEEERDLLDSKYDDWKDTKQHKHNIEHQRRQSLGKP